MLAFNIGWQEVMVILLFLLGVIVIPLPGRWMRRAARRPVRWSDQFRAPPVEQIHDVVEAFFCSYPRGEYALVAKERFRLVFQRGQQRQEDDEGIVLSLRGQQEGPDEMPVTLRVLLQPRADGLMVTMRHEVLPRRSLGPITRKKLASRFARELRDFREYLHEHFGRPAAAAAEIPRPVKRIEAKHKVE